MPYWHFEVFIGRSYLLLTDIVGLKIENIFAACQVLELSWEAGADEADLINTLLAAEEDIRETEW